MKGQLWRGGKLAARVIASEEAAALMMKDGVTLMAGEFGLVGVPLTLIRSPNTSPRRDLTIITNNLGEPRKDLGGHAPGREGAPGDRLALHE